MLVIIALIAGCATETPPTAAPAPVEAEVTVPPITRLIPATYVPPTIISSPTATHVPPTIISSPTATPPPTLTILPPTPTSRPPLPAPTSVPQPIPTDLIAAKPPELIPVGNFGRPLSLFTTYGDFVYVITGEDMLVIDFSDPANPQQVNKIPDLGLHVLSLAIDGNILLVTTIPNSGTDTIPVDIFFYDLTIPASPHLASKSMSVFGVSNSIVSDGLHFVMSGGTHHPFALRVLDFSDPTNVRQTAVYEIPDKMWLNMPRNVHIMRKEDVITIFMDEERLAIDVSDPTALVETAVTDSTPLTPPPPTAEPSRYQLLPDAMQQLDLTNPANPVVVGEFVWPTYTAHDIAIIDHFAYAASDHTTLRVIDISDPATPRLAQSFPAAITRLFTAGPYLGALEQPGNAPPQLRIWDTTAAPDLALISVTKIPVATAVQDITVVNDLLFIATEKGLHIINIANLRAPQTVTLWSAPALINGITADSDTAYLAADDGLHILNLSDPARPQEIGAASHYADLSCTPFAPDHLSFGLTDLVIINQAIYAATTDGCTVVIDITDPTQPKLVKTALRGVTTSHYHLRVWQNRIVGIIKDTATDISRRLTFHDWNFAPDIGYLAPAAQIELTASLIPHYAIYEDYIFAADGQMGISVTHIVSD